MSGHYPGRRYNNSHLYGAADDDVDQYRHSAELAPPYQNYNYRQPPHFVVRQQPQTTYQSDPDETAIDVQSQVQQNAISVLNTSRRTLPILATIYLLWNVAEIIFFSTVLALTWNKPCDEPTIRIIIIARLVRDLAMGFVHARRVFRIEETEMDEKIQNLSRLSILLFFIFSQQWYTEGDVCRKHAPLLYWSGISVIVLLYMTILAPLFLVLAICLCLPCVVSVFSWLQIGDIPHAARQSDIDQLETFEFSNDNNEQQQQQQQSTDHVEQPVATAPQDRTKINVRDGQQQQQHEEKSSTLYDNTIDDEYKDATAPEQSITRNNNNTRTTTQQPPPPPPKPSNSTTAECGICLCEYEPKEQLVKLKCNHVFHKNCIAEWLKINSTCPIDRSDAMTGTAASIEPRTGFRNFL